MISLELLRKSTESIRLMCKRRGVNIDIDEFINIDNDLKQAVREVETLRQERNKLSKQNPGFSNVNVLKLKQRIADLDSKIEKLQVRRDDIWKWIPNILDETVPDGESDEDNLEVRRWGELQNFNFEPKWHDEIALKLRILNTKNGVKVASSGFTYWVGDGARLLHALFNWTLEILQSRGFTYLMTPILAKSQTLFGTGYLPFFEDQIYNITNTDLSLIGTSEQTLVAYHMDEIMNLEEEAIKYTAFTPCFRTEAGSYGKETKGVFRMHQFYKVEQIIFCLPEFSQKWHEFCLENEEFLFQQLRIPYRVVNVCVGSLGSPASKKYDIEAYFPAYGDFREVTSNSNLTDYQTRRSNIRFKRFGKTEHPHTISATGITERTLLAIIENYQNEDGSITVPNVLKPYMNGQEKITK